MAKGRNIVIVGATSAIAEHCARLWLRQGNVAHMSLIGRDAGRVEQLAADLRVRSPEVPLQVLSGDLGDPAEILRMVNESGTGHPADVVLIAHGYLPDQAVCQTDLAAAQDAMQVNAISPVLFAEAFIGPMEHRDTGTLGVIGSVAGDRGRKSNYVYGAAKGLVTRYVQGLQHRVAGTRIKVVLVKPGPTDTPMTAHLKAQGAKLADASAVAQAIVGGLERGRPVVYAPARWALIMMVIRHLPRFVFNRMDI
jgi:decaprenylphospho-beta-D-erythro-pentofuranosid-2-ulose 2-reductase